MTTGLEDVAKAIRFAAKHLGTGDAATDMGALEAVGAVIRDTGEAVASAIGGVAQSIDGLADALNNVADAVRSRGVNS